MDARVKVKIKRIVLFFIYLSIVFLTVWFFTNGWKRTPIERPIEALVLSFVFVCLTMHILMRRIVIIATFLLLVCILVGLLIDNVMLYKVSGSLLWGLIMVLFISVLPELIKKGRIDTWERRLRK